MKMLICVALLLGLLFAVPSAESQSQQESSYMYSIFDRFIDEVRLFFSYGDDRVSLNLEIREKEINSAITNAKNENNGEAIQNLNNAQKRLQMVQESVSLGTMEEVKESVQKTIDRINNETDLPVEFDEYVLEEKKTHATAELTEKIFNFCMELAREDYASMLREEECNPETAPPGLQNELKELKKIQEESFNRLMLDIRSCIDDPGTCNCDDVSDAVERARCQEMIALALKCEYTGDDYACSELESMKPVAESFVPDFLMNLFSQKSGMIDYDIEKSDVPPECYNENNKPQCAQYNGLKEGNSKCWDDDGNFLEDVCGGFSDREPTMRESIPQCYDDENNFLEEKCGKITTVRNEEGLINYIIENEIEALIEEFGNASVSRTIDINGTTGQASIMEMKREIDMMEEQIEKRTFAPGTSGVGEPGVKEETVVDDGGDTGDGGLTPEVRIETGGDDSGDGGLEPVVEESVATGDDGLEPVVVTDVQ